MVVEPELLTREEVAKFLRISIAEVYRMTRDGQLPAIKWGKRSVRYRSKDILAFLESHTLRKKRR